MHPRPQVTRREARRRLEKEGQVRRECHSMRITIHLLLYGAVIATALVSVALSPTIAAGRPVRILFMSLVPYLVVAILSGLMMSVAGKPRREWLLPMCGLVAVW